MTTHSKIFLIAELTQAATKEQDAGARQALEQAANVLIGGDEKVAMAARLYAEFSHEYLATTAAALLLGMQKEGYMDECGVQKFVENMRKVAKR